MKKKILFLILLLLIPIVAAQDELLKASIDSVRQGTNYIVDKIDLLQMLVMIELVAIIFIFLLCIFIIIKLKPKPSVTTKPAQHMTMHPPPITHPKINVHPRIVHPMKKQVIKKKSPIEDLKTDLIKGF